jgi:hypothetical protein
VARNKAAHLRQVAAPRPLQDFQFGLHAAYFRANFFEEALTLTLCLAHDEHGLALRLFLGFLAQLLGRNESVVHSAIAFAKRAQLFVKRARFLIEILIDATQSFQFVGDLIAKLVYAGWLIATESVAKIVTPYIERREMESFINH